MINKRQIFILNNGGFNMELNIKQMNYNEAKQISKWIYKEPYSIYSMDESENCINELLNGYYYSVSEEKTIL